MPAANVKIVETLAAPAAPTPKPGAGWLDFASYLARRHSITGELLSKSDSAEGAGRQRRLRELWELTNLSASDFADEAARFFNLPRVTLPQLLAATPLAAQFSYRFLRDAMAFPCRIDPGQESQLVVADPTDLRPIRAVQIVLGGPISVALASFEDIATVLSERAEEAGAAAPERSVAASPQGEDDIESLRDRASGAPVVRAGNELL
jgi:general secretion pathway protein E